MGKEKMTGKNTAPIELAEIVYEKPPSGAFKEVLFGSARGNTLWVRFSDKDGAAEWIGKFGCGVSSFMRVTKAIEPDCFIILTGGFAYLVNASTQTLLNQHFEVCIHDIAYDPKKNHFIAGDIRLRVIEEGREIWASKRISVDGIHSMCVEGRILSGTTVVGYEGEEDRFSFDLDSREFVSGPDFSSWDVALSQHTKKPWWKFLK
jgi:hypothetical protein